MEVRVQRNVYCIHLATLLEKRIDLANLKGSSVCLFGKSFWVEVYDRLFVFKKKLQVEQN